MKKKQTLMAIQKMKKFKGIFPVSFGHSYFEDFELPFPSEQEQKEALPDCQQDEKESDEAI